MGTELACLDVGDKAIDHLADEYGEAFIQKLTEAFGGQSIRVPANVATLSNGHFLVAKLGLLDAEDLVAICGGELIYIPSGGRKHSFKDKVKSLCEQGLTENQIASTIGISDRQVRRYKSRLGISTKANSNKAGKKPPKATAEQRLQSYLEAGVPIHEIATRLSRTVREVNFFIENHEWPEDARKRAAGQS